MKLTDLDAEFVAPYLTFYALEKLCGEPVNVKDGVARFDTPTGAITVPVGGEVRQNKALDALYKVASMKKESLLETTLRLCTIYLSSKGGKG